MSPARDSSHCFQQHSPFCTPNGDCWKYWWLCVAFIVTNILAKYANLPVGLSHCFRELLQANGGPSQHKHWHKQSACNSPSLALFVCDNAWPPCRRTTTTQLQPCEREERASFSSTGVVIRQYLPLSVLCIVMKLHSRHFKQLFIQHCRVTRWRFVF